MPVHESDLADERWAKAQWAHYVLWEKLELRLRRRKLLWISLTSAVFLALSAVPIVIDRANKWTAMSAIRKLAQLVNELKSEASLQHTPYRIRFGPDGSLAYEVERVGSCMEGSEARLVRSGTLQPSGGATSHEDAYVMLSPVQAESLGLAGVVNSFCYDPLKGSEPATRGQSLVGFGVLVAKDLAAGRTDRLSVLLVQGPSAELSFD